MWKNEFSNVVRWCDQVPISIRVLISLSASHSRNPASLSFCCHRTTTYSSSFGFVLMTATTNHLAKRPLGLELYFIWAPIVKMAMDIFAVTPLSQVDCKYFCGGAPDFASTIDTCLSFYICDSYSLCGAFFSRKIHCFCSHCILLCSCKRTQCPGSRASNGVSTVIWWRWVCQCLSH
jgi:hypothetical protein